MTVTTFVCWRKSVPSPRTEFCLSTAPAGTITETTAPPVFEVVTVATVTHAPFTSQRIRTVSCLPYPVRVTVTDCPRLTELGLTMIRATTSTSITTLTPPAEKVTRLPAPPSVAGALNAPFAVPAASVVVVPTSTTLPPGRFHEIVRAVFAGKCWAEYDTLLPTDIRVVESKTSGGNGIDTVTAPV